MADPRKGKTGNILLSAAVAAVFTAAAWSGLFQRPDKWIADALFQRPSYVSGDIIIIGIDDVTLSELGPYNQWDRSIMASALEQLASDPDNLPAVVAIDTLYTGTSTEEEDLRLTNAVSRLGNVVTATVAVFNAFDNSYTILEYDEPFDQLKEVSTQGHINAMYDLDGIMRHALLYVEPDENTRVYSMAYQTAKIYLESRGESISSPVTNSRGHFYIPYTAVPGRYYDGVSLSSLIRGEVPSDYYAGKVVLIGPYARGLQDSYFTPIDPSNQMYGVELQANVIQSFIDGNFKQEMSDLPQLAVLFLVCALSMFLFFDRKVLPSGICCIVIIACGIAGSVILYSSGLVTHPLWVPLGTATMYIISVGAHYVKAAKQRSEVTRTFERYVAPSIVKEIMKEGTDNLALGGRTCDIAVLFVDVRGFTSMSERLTPEKVVFILNRYLSMASSCIEEHSGTLDKFVGDAVMAFWGAPLPQEDSAYLACRTALDIIQGAEEVSSKLKEEIGEEFHVGVGVHFGPAVVGNMGSEHRMDYTAIGDTVNTAARLEANAPGSTCYISRTVADILGDRAKCTSLGSTVKLKGKTDGFEILILNSLDGGDDKDA